MSYGEVIVKLFIHTRSISSSSDSSSSALCFLRYEWRLPLAMKGITMYGACSTRQILRIPITRGCTNVFIFRHSFRMFATSLELRKPKYHKNGKDNMRQTVRWTVHADVTKVEDYKQMCLTKNSNLHQCKPSF